MALSAEQQAQVDTQNAMDDHRTQNQIAMDVRRVKLDTLRMAKEILVENRRTQAAVDAVNITSSAVTELAADLSAFVNS